MITSKMILFLALALPLNAANTDDEIIKNLDFFQNIDLVKDENPFANVTFANKAAVDQTSKQNTKVPDSLIDMEKKQ